MAVSGTASHKYSTPKIEVVAEIFTKIQDFRKNLKFSRKSAIFAKTPRFSRKFKIFARIQDFRENPRFSQKSEIFAKI